MKTAKEATQDTQLQYLNAIKTITLDGWSFWCHLVIGKGRYGVLTPDM